jgi:hypothetical protein
MMESNVKSHIQWSKKEPYKKQKLETSSQEWRRQEMQQRKQILAQAYKCKQMNQLTP